MLQCARFESENALLQPDAYTSDLLMLCRTDEDQAPNTGSLDVESGAAVPAAAVPYVVTYKDLFLRFVWMGWVAFGGPTAHIALFQKVTTERSLAPCPVDCNRGTVFFLQAVRK